MKIKIYKLGDLLIKSNDYHLLFTKNINKKYIVISYFTNELLIYKK